MSEMQFSTANSLSYFFLSDYTQQTINFYRPMFSKTIRTLEFKSAILVYFLE